MACILAETIMKSTRRFLMTCASLLLAGSVWALPEPRLRRCDRLPPAGK
jgi:hypothetical protein